MQVLCVSWKRDIPDLTPANNRYRSKGVDTRVYADSRTEALTQLQLSCLYTLGNGGTRDLLMTTVQSIPTTVERFPEKSAIAWRFETRNITGSYAFRRVPTPVCPHREINVAILLIARQRRAGTERTSEEGNFDSVTALPAE